MKPAASPKEQHWDIWWSSHQKKFHICPRGEVTAPNYDWTRIGEVEGSSVDANNHANRWLMNKQEEKRKNL